MRPRRRSAGDRCRAGGPRCDGSHRRALPAPRCLLACRGAVRPGAARRGARALASSRSNILALMVPLRTDMYVPV
ncbi:hypothetical protein, partial [Streptomyces rhizosphaericus]|uniref:hypothetical protein n=1 Tax=Streptomyces rhizosphaericus TaxID=114699 RepID=UPI0035D3E4CF